MSCKQFIYEKLVLKINKHKNLKKTLKFFYDSLYKNTSLNKDYRIKKWINKNNQFLNKNNLCPVFFDGKTTYFVNKNIKYAYDSSIDGGSAPKFIDSEFDTEILEYIKKKFPKSSEITIFDIGANIGSYSLDLATTFTKGKIYAFEPIKKTFDILLKNVDLNKIKNINCYDLAISEKNGTLLMNTDEFTGNHIVTNKEKNVLEIKTQTLDTFVSSNKINSVNLIKCDVEGAELLVLKGAINTIKKFNPVIILEVYETWTTRYGYTPKELFSLMFELGYGYRLAGKELKTNTNQLEQDLKEDINFIFEKL